MAIDPVSAISGSGAARTVAPVSAVQAVAYDPWQAATGLVDGNQVPPIGNDLAEVLAGLNGTPEGRALLAQYYPGLASDSAAEAEAKEPTAKGFWAWLTDMFSGGESPNLQQAESAVLPQAAWMGVPNAGNDAVGNFALDQTTGAYKLLGEASPGTAGAVALPEVPVATATFGSASGANAAVSDMSVSLSQRAAQLTVPKQKG